MANHDEANKVWLSDSDGTFTAVSESYGSASSQKVALGDLDGDGDLDAFVVNTGGQANTVWLNDGDGTFAASAESYGSADSNSVSLGDLDGDSDLDAFVGNHLGPDKVWLNDGDGTFTAVAEDYGGGTAPRAVLGDLDGDGDLDAFVVANGANRVWTNDGDGTFTAGAETYGAAWSTGVTLGDLDGDGDLDAFVTNHQQPNQVWTNDGDGTFTVVAEDYGTASSSSVALGDIDKDGDLDAAVTNGSSEPNAVWLNDGDGTFTKHATTYGISNSTDVALGDLDGDGDLDVYIANGGSGEANRVYWCNQGPTDIALSSTQVSPTLSAPLTVGALSGTDPDAGDVLTYSVVDPDGNAGSELFSTRVDKDGNWYLDTAVAVAPGNYSVSIRAADKMAETYDETVGITVQALSGTAVFTRVNETYTAGNTFRVALGDLDGDGDLDAITANHTGDPNRVWLNDGDGTYQLATETYGTGNSYSVNLGDLDGDGDLDAFVGNSGQANRVWLNDGDDTFTVVAEDYGSANTFGTALGDLDGDGDLDVYAANWTQPNKVWLNDGDGTFTASAESYGSGNSEWVALGDFDGDGDLDAFVANYNQPDKVWLNDGDGTFTAVAEDYGTGPSYDVALGDVDNDGDLDVFVASNAGGSGAANILWLGDGDGTFTASSETYGSSPTSEIVLGDLDGDGDLDAFAANSSTQPNLVWRNDGDGTFTQDSTTYGTSGSNAAALGDLDGDGDLDAFFGNPGAAHTVWLNGSVPVATVSATDSTASEAGPDTGTFTVTLSSAPSSDVTVGYMVSGTATNGTDYTTIAESVTISAGQTTGTITITPIDDSGDEDAETVSIILSNGTGYTLGSTVEQTITIADNDETTPSATVSATDATASETSSATGSFTVTLSSAPTSGVAVNYTVSGTATAGTDYTALAGTVTIAAGQTTGTMTVTPTDDITVEGDETVIVTLSTGTGYTVGTTSTATVTIADDDVPAATISATDSSAAEAGPDTGTFTVTLSSAPTSNVTVNYTVSGTATSGTDYTALSGTVTIAAGQTAGTMTVTPIDDTTVEGGETVVVTLSAGTGYSAGGTTEATVTIADDDVPTATIAETDASASETGPDTGTLTISLSDAPASDVTVSYSVSGTATASTDYTALDGTATVTAGQSSTTLTVTPTDDSEEESAETVVVTLATGTGYALGAAATGTVTILDNDQPTEFGVSGQVTRGGAPVPNCWVDLFDGATIYGWVANTKTDALGNYTLSPLAAGSYAIRAYDPLTHLPVDYSSNPVAVSNANVTGIDIALNSTYAVTGQVTRGGQGVADCWLDIFTESDRKWVANTQTDSSGNYSLGPVSDGTYTVHAYDPQTKQEVPYTNNPVTVSGATVSDINIDLDSSSNTYTLNGQVLRSSSGVSSAWVDLFTSTGTWVANTQTDSSGAYSFTKLDAGSYSVYAYDPSAFNAQTAYSGNPVTIASSDVSGIDISFTSLFSISGQVRRDGSGVENAWVDVFTSTGSWVKNGQTDSSGNYSFTGLDAGSYSVYAYDPANFNAQTAYGSNPVTLSSSSATGVDIAFVAACALSGQVTRSATGVANAWVDVFTESGSWVKNMQTDSSGNYSFASLAAGSYKVYAYDPYNDLAQTAYSSNPVTLSSSDVSGIDITFTSTYSISGQVTRSGSAVADCWIDAFDSATSSWVANTKTDSSGNYTLSGLSVGSFTVKAYDPTSRLPVEYTSNPVNLSSGSATGIDISLGTGYTVSGQVTRGNQEIDDCWLDIFTYGTHIWVDNTKTDADGNYTLGPVTDGSYTVHAYDPQTKQEVPYRSNPIEVSGGTVTSVDISLPANEQ